MLDHTKSYAEKIYSTDAEQAGPVHKLDVKLQSLCGSDFSLFVVRILAKPYHLWSELTNNTVRKQRWVHFFFLKFECHIGITSYYCVILKVMILHDAIKQFTMGCCVFLKKKNLFL